MCSARLFSTSRLVWRDLQQCYCLAHRRRQFCFTRHELTPENRGLPANGPAVYNTTPKGGRTYAGDIFFILFSLSPAQHFGSAFNYRLEQNNNV